MLESTVEKNLSSASSVANGSVIVVRTVLIPPQKSASVTTLLLDELKTRSTRSYTVSFRVCEWMGLTMYLLIYDKKCLNSLNKNTFILRNKNI